MPPPPTFTDLGFDPLRLPLAPELLS